MLHIHKFTFKDFHPITLASKGDKDRKVIGVEGLECKCGKRKVNYPDLGYGYTKASDMPHFREWEIYWLEGGVKRVGLWERIKLAFGSWLLKISM